MRAATADRTAHSAAVVPAPERGSAARTPPCPAGRTPPARQRPLLGRQRATTRAEHASHDHDTRPGTARLSPTARPPPLTAPLTRRRSSQHGSVWGCRPCSSGTACRTPLAHQRPPPAAVSRRRLEPGRCQPRHRRGPPTRLPPACPQPPPQTPLLTRRQPSGAGAGANRPRPPDTTPRPGYPLRVSGDLGVSRWQLEPRHASHDDTDEAATYPTDRHAGPPAQVRHRHGVDTATAKQQPAAWRHLSAGTGCGHRPRLPAHSTGPARRAAGAGPASRGAGTADSAGSVTAPVRPARAAGIASG